MTGMRNRLTLGIRKAYIHGQARQDGQCSINFSDPKGDTVRSGSVVSQNSALVAHDLWSIDGRERDQRDRR